MTDTYKRAVFVAPGEIRIDELPIPEPGPRQVLVKVKACALCTWEQRVFTGEEKFYPLAGGHEVSGELVKVGQYVYTDAQIGDKVMASPLIRCGYCESCRRGMDNICDNMRKSFRETDVPGPAGLAEYILLDDYQLYQTTNGASYEEISLTEPLACVLRSVRKARVQRADNVVVVGAGVMGMLHLLLCKQAGARVIVSEIDPTRAAFARQMGADAIINPLEKPFAEQVRGLTHGRGADVIFCAVSIAAAVEQSIDAAAKGGRIHVYASIHPRSARITIDPNPFHSNEIVLTGSMSQDKDDVLQAVRLISRGLVDVKPFISLVLPFDRLVEALQAAIRPDTYRVIVTM
ncbi:MAG: zinc-binding dehydrogenase [Chloroflexi bacterium]|nr:zinc-binding dehydrogenase [Chloroflexota bacterium]MBU1746521.1 zinc-binding dehydrogenase [Chloroflexota bacterium]MBU1879427.1 zinc-binding dehydrogenase [Chloroflexota bacterium]